MANTLSKQGIETGEIIEALHVSQSVDAFTGANAYNIKISGSLNVTGSVLISGSDLIYSDLPESASNFEALVYDTGSGRVYYTTGSVGLQGVQGVQGLSGSQGAQGAQGLQGTVGSLGPQGTQGTSGNFGGASFDYTFTASIDDSDPGTGKIKVNQAIQNTATEMYIDDTDDNGNSIISFLQTVDSVTSAVKGHVRLSNAATSSAFLLYAISDLEIYTGSAYSKIDISVEATSSAQPFAGGEDVIVSFVTTGDQGSQGPQGSVGPSGSGIIENYTNPGDNRIITSVDSASIHAEENLQFDGSNLIVSGNIQLSSGSFLIGAISSSADSTASFGELTIGGGATISGALEVNGVNGITVASGGLNTNGDNFFGGGGTTSISGSTIIEGPVTVTDPGGVGVNINTDTSISGNLDVTGNANFGGGTGSSVTVTSNLIVDGPAVFSNSASFSATSSFTGPVIISSSLNVTQGITGSLQGTASVAENSLLFDGKDSATFATTGSNIFKDSQTISGSLKLAPAADPGTSDTGSTYFFTSASNFGNDECDFYYRNKGVLWDQEWIEYGIGSGLIFGGIVTFSGNQVFITPGGGLVADYNAKTGSADATVPTQIKFGPITSSITYLTSSQYSHLLIDENGNLVQQVEDFTPQQYLQKIPLGTLTHLNYAAADSFGEEKQTTYAGTAQSNQFIRAFGPLKEQGYDLSDSGSNLSFNAASGVTFKLGGFYSKDPNSPSVFNTPALTSQNKIIRVYQTGTGGFVGDSNGGAFYSTIDPTKYDDGSGTLVNISGSTTTIQRVFLGPTSERFYIYYGQATYDSVSQAVANLTTEQFVESLTTSKSLTFIGYIITQANATDLSDRATTNLINAGLFRNTAGASGGGTSTISNLGDITDVNISSPQTNQYLKYNAGIWENANINYSEINQSGSGIISSSAQLENLGVTVASGSTSSTTGSSEISGSLSVVGSTTVSGSVSSEVIEMSVINSGIIYTELAPSKGNFFSLTLPPNQQVQVNLSGLVNPGQTVNLRVIQNSTTLSDIHFNTGSGQFVFPSGSITGSTQGLSREDVFSFVSFDNSRLYGTVLRDYTL